MRIKTARRPNIIDSRPQSEPQECLSNRIAKWRDPPLLTAPGGVNYIDATLDSMETTASSSSGLSVPCVSGRKLSIAAGRPTRKPCTSLEFTFEKFKLGGGFHAFRKHRQPEGPSEPQNRSDTRRRLIVHVHRPDEGGVDLYLVKRKCAQIRER